MFNKNKYPSAKVYLKSLLSCVISLFVILLMAGVAILLILWYYKSFPAYSSEGSGWGGIDDALSIAVWMVMITVLAISWWMVKLFRNLYRYRKEKHVFTSHLGLLLLTVSIAAYFISRNHLL
jgi:Kef-type K+ transport system membrane component KefB